MGSIPLGAAVGSPVLPSRPPLGCREPAAAPLCHPPAPRPGFRAQPSSEARLSNRRVSSSFCRPGV